jgi:hypothetical protein
MALKPGTISPLDLSSSMAQAMEDAFRHHWPLVMADMPIPFDSRFLQLLFVAIAQGVVRHLEENPEAFKVRVEAPLGGTFSGEVIRVETVGVQPAALE